MLKICFSGHRPKNLPWGFNEKNKTCKRFKKNMLQLIEFFIKQYHYGYFITGMALGIDMICAELILKLRKKYKIKLEAAIPCLNQCEKWNDKMKKRYLKILNKCDLKTVISNEYTATCMNERNKYMVMNSDLLIAVWNGKTSGTGNTVKIAKKYNKCIKIIDINDYF